MSPSAKREKRQRNMSIGLQYEVVRLCVYSLREYGVIAPPDPYDEEDRRADDFHLDLSAEECARLTALLRASG